MKFVTSYKINDSTLKKFTKKEKSSVLLQELRSFENRYFSTKEALIEALNGSSHASELQPYHRWLIQKSRGYFRMDPWIKDRVIREWVEALVFALVVASLVRTFVVAPFKIPSGSMIPTIAVGDHIFASMFSYGIPVPGTDIKLLPQPVERGDIVIFPYPRDPSVDYIKRVVALGGETIQLERDQVYIDGKPIPQSYAFFDPDVNLNDYEIENLFVSGDISNFEPITVPDGHVFVMGDNRYNSADSRFWGFVDIKKIKGKGQFIYWSKEERPGILGFFEMDSYHPQRILHKLK